MEKKFQIKQSFEDFYFSKWITLQVVTTEKTEIWMETAPVCKIEDIFFKQK